METIIGLMILGAVVWAQFKARDGWSVNRLDHSICEEIASSKRPPLLG